MLTQGYWVWCWSQHTVRAVVLGAHVVGPWNKEGLCGSEWNGLCCSKDHAALLVELRPPHRQVQGLADKETRRRKIVLHYTAFKVIYEIILTRAQFNGMIQNIADTQWLKYLLDTSSQHKSWIGEQWQVNIFCFLLLD